ncbi:MAG: hypothetical protein QOF50_896 [Gaiellaceae bacterium]|jgi:hypothetical protein|nr:hypothetical protein [Gaiellaceae bacterium]
MLAAIRPDSVNVPLFLHVLGAMVLVGALATAALVLILGWRRDAAAWTRLAFRTLLFAALPAYIVMRVGAQWTYSREHLDAGGDDPTWVGIGFITSDAGALLLLISLLLTGLAARKLRRNAEAGTSTLGRIGGAITVLLLAVYVVAIWAMTTKPR